jgi:hypothetical protein
MTVEPTGSALPGALTHHGLNATDARQGGSPDLELKGQLLIGPSLNLLRQLFDQPFEVVAPFKRLPEAAFVPGAFDEIPALQPDRQG